MLKINRVTPCDQKIPKAGSCEYLGIMLRNNLNWVDQVNYRAQKAWKTRHFVMRVLKKEIGIQKVYPTRHWYCKEWKLWTSELKFLTPCYNDVTDCSFRKFVSKFSAL